MSRTVVIGLGNPILADDGVGVKVAVEVRKALENSGDSEITVIEACTGGLRLMEMMVGYDRAILIDAITDWPGGNPGNIHRMTLEDLRQVSPAQHTASVHDATLPTALAAGKLLGLHLPHDYVIFAIDVTNVSEFSEEPTPAVAPAVPQAVEAVLEELFAKSKVPREGFQYGIT
jgi:hydrogenase maturation protease